MPALSTVSSRPPDALGLEAHRLEAEFRRELRWSMLLSAAALFVAGGLLGSFALHVQGANGRVEDSVARLALALGVGFAVLVGLRRMGALREPLERTGATRNNLRALADTVQGWVIEHVLDEDRRLAEFIRSQSQEVRLAAAAAGP